MEDCERDKPLECIDSHIHLWPADAANHQGHAWMTRDHPLAKPHLISYYLQATRQDSLVNGVVYVETDRRYDTPVNDLDLQTWAKGPLDEIRFLRSIVEGAHGTHAAQLLSGIVLWAPMDRPPHILEKWLRLAEVTAGDEAWKHVKGFRFLLQDITDKHAFEELVLGFDFGANLKFLGRAGFSFDVGVAARSAGVWQLEYIAEAMERAHVDVVDEDKVVFVLDHLCKPDFAVAVSPQEDIVFSRWKRAVQRMARVDGTYMKLSGAFSELPSGNSEPAQIAAHMKPWMQHLFECFSSRRIMFGSDWPICNLKGPDDKNSWIAWRDVVALIMQDPNYGLNYEDRKWIWNDTAIEAYRLTANQGQNGNQH